MGSNIFSFLGWAIGAVVQVFANVITVFVAPGSSSSSSNNNNNSSGSGSGGSTGSGSTGGNPRLNTAEANFFADLYGNEYTVSQLLSMFSIDTSNANSSDPLNVYGYYVGYDPSATMTPAQFIAIPYGDKTGTDLTQQIRSFLVGQLNSYILQHPNYQAYLANKTDTTIQPIRTDQNTPYSIPHEISINRKAVVPQLQGLQYITDDQLMGAAVVALNNPAYSSDIQSNLMVQQQQMVEGAGFGGQISYNLFNIYFSNSTSNFINPPMDASVLSFVETYNYMPQGVVIAGVLYPNGATGVVENFQTAYNAVLAEIQAPYQASTGINLFADQTLIWELMVNFSISDITSLMSMYSNRRQESINELFGLSSNNPIFNFLSSGSSASFGLTLQGSSDPYLALKQSINLSAMTNGSTQNNPSPGAKTLLASSNATTTQIQQWINEYGCYNYQFFCLAAQQMNAIYAQIMTAIQQNVSYTPGVNEITKQENKFNLVSSIAVNAAGDSSITSLTACLDLLSMRIDALPSTRPNSWVMYQIHRGGYSSNSAYLSNNASSSLLYTPSPDFRNLWINEISQIVNSVFSDPNFLSSIRSNLMTCVDSAASFASPLNNMYQAYVKDQQVYISQLQQVFSVANASGFYGKSYFDFANQNMNIAYLAQDYNFFDLTFPINIPKYSTNAMSIIAQGPNASDAKSITDGPSLRAWISSKTINPNYTQAIEIFVQGFIAKTLLDLTWWQMYNLTYVYPADDYWRQIATVTPLAPQQNAFSGIAIGPDGTTSSAPSTTIPPFTQNGTSTLLGQHRFSYGVPSSLNGLTATAFFGSPNGASHASSPGYASGGDNAGYWGAWRVANIAMYDNINSNLVPSDDWITRQTEVGIQYSSAIKGVTAQNAIGAYANGLYGDICGASNATNGIYCQQNSAFSPSNSAQVQDFSMQSIFSPIMQQISTLYTIATSGGWSIDYTNMISNYRTPVIAMHWAYSLGITETNVGVRQGDIDQSTKYFQDLTNNQSIVVGGVAPPPGTVLATGATGATGTSGGANQAAGVSTSSTGTNAQTASGANQAAGGSAAGATTQVTTITTIGSTMITNNLYKDIMLSSANFANSNPRSQFCSAFLCNPFTHLSKGTSQYYQMTFDKNGSATGYAYGGTRQTGIDPSLEPAYIVMPGDSSPHYDVQQQILNKMANDSQLNYRTGGMIYHNALAFTYFMSTLNIPYNTDFNS